MLAPSIILFYAAATLTLGGGLGVVMARNIVYAALALLISLMGVSGIFLLAFAEFLALVQVLIYGGAVIIVVLFAIMLTRNSEYPHISDNRQWPLAAITSLALAVIFGVAMWQSAPSATNSNSPAFADLGNSLFTRWAVPFEIASIVLLVALIGALIIARSDSSRGE